MNRVFSYYKIHGTDGNPDIKKEIIYSKLPCGLNTISTPKGIREGFQDYKWLYGSGVAQPYDIISAKSSRGVLDDKKYNIPEDVYLRQTKPIFVNNLESSFQPPIYTPEEAKLVQGEQTRYSR
jgi:hypothetical protein